MSKTEAEPEFTPTEEQQAIIASAKLDRKSMMIQAYAGCAKTTTLILAGRQIRVPALALAFNKSIAGELKGKLPSNFTVQTMNALGHSAWFRRRDVGAPKLDERKLSRLIREVAGARPPEEWELIRDLVQGAMQRGHKAEGDWEALARELFPELATGKTASVINESLGEVDLELLAALGKEILEKDIAEALRGIISYDDQIYCPTVLGGGWPKWPVVMVDEAQDLSVMNHRMLELASREGARWIVVGDKCQAIYGFRGAHTNSMEALRAAKPEWTDRSLTQTFRCPRRIVERMRGHAPGFAAAQGAPEGAVDRWRDWDWAKLRHASGDGTLAILCRNNAPLLSLAFKLLRSGIGIKFLGRDIGKGLARLAKRLAPSDATPAEALRVRIAEWAKAEDSERAQDQADGLLAVLEGSGARTAGALRAALAKVFASTEGLVTLSSIHRAKGLEWDCVMHLDPWRVPKKGAKGWEHEQELNLVYVCETRTKRTLVLASLDGYGAPPEGREERMELDWDEAGPTS